MAASRGYQLIVRGITVTTSRMIEEDSPGLPVLTAGSAFLGLEFREGVTFEEAKDLTAQIPGLPLALATGIQLLFQCVLKVRNAAITGANWTSKLNHENRAPATTTCYQP